MKFTVVNKKISSEDVKIRVVGASCMILIGDAETITSSTFSDSPADSLIVSPEVTLNVRQNGSD